MKFGVEGSEGVQISGNIFADGSVRASTGFYGSDFLGRKSLVSGKKFCILTWRGEKEA